MKGFSLLELLIATTIALVFAAAVAAVVPSLQAFFEQTPAIIDLQQRGRTAVDTIAQAVRSAERVVLLDEEPAGGSFRQLMTIAAKTNAARGLVAEQQLDPGDDLVLSDLHCPNVPDVCGFMRGSVAVVTDGTERFDLFTVGAIDARRWSIAPQRPFDEPYRVHATVVEVDAQTFRLDRQPDGSLTLVRETGTGAVQPIVDRVSELRFANTFDARNVDVTLKLRPHGTMAGDTTRHIAIAARNVR